MQGQTDLSHLADAWIDGRVRRSEIRQATARVERARLADLVRLHGRKPAAQLDREAIGEWLEAIAKKRPSTRYGTVNAVSRFCRWLVDEGHIDRDPMSKMGRVRMPRRVPRALNESEVRAVVEACRGDDVASAIVWLMVGCGLRCVDTSNLDLADYDPRRATLSVRGKGDHERVLPVPDNAREALETWLGHRGWWSGPLFPGERTDRRSAAQISKEVARAMRAAGVHRSGDGKSAHSLRHTAASDVLDRCHDLRVVQQMLGHVSLATTQIYLRRADLDRLRQAMEGRRYIRGPTLFDVPLRGTASAGVHSPDAGSPTEDLAATTAQEDQWAS